jgi:hypothetical protein
MGQDLIEGESNAAYTNGSEKFAMQLIFGANTV